MELYQLMEAQLESLMEGCRLPLPVLSNAAALLWQSLPQINWAGFYLRKEDTLYLGPFQGKHACTVIPLGKGVCGTAALSGMVQLVEDVHLFPGHIACDSASASEIVLPLKNADGYVLGVMDLDSPIRGRFDRTDAEGLQRLAEHIVRAADWSSGLLGA